MRNFQRPSVFYFGNYCSYTQTSIFLKLTFSVYRPYICAFSTSAFLFWFQIIYYGIISAQNDFALSMALFPYNKLMQNM